MRNNEIRKRYNLGGEIKFKTTMLRSNLCDYSDLCILLKETTKITRAVADAEVRNADERNKQVTCQQPTPFTDCISEINNIQVNNAKDLDVVILMYNIMRNTAEIIMQKHQEIHGSTTRMMM